MSQSDKKCVRQGFIALSYYLYPALAETYSPQSSQYPAPHFANDLQQLIAIFVPR